MITFARDVTVDYDTISNPDAAAGVSKCQLFDASPALYDRVAYNTDDDVLSGTNLTGAMHHAVEILRQGRDNRPNVLQVNERLKRDSPVRTSSPQLLRTALGELNFR